MKEKSNNQDHNGLFLKMLILLNALVSSLSKEDELAERNLRLSREINDIHQKNIRLQQMVSRLKSMSVWKENTLRCVFENQVRENKFALTS